MGRGLREGPGAMLALGRGTSSARSEQPAPRQYAWHYTTAISAKGIRGGCDFLASERGTDGPGVYFTDLPPGPDRERISRTIWDHWRGARMQAYIRVPFDPADMIPSARYAHVWYVPEGGYSLHGMDDLAIGFWTGPDWSHPDDVGDWTFEPFSCAPIT